MNDTMSLADRLDKLRDLLINEDEFDVTSKFFFDRLGRDVTSPENGKRAKNPSLKKIVQSIVGGVFNQKVLLTKYIAIFVPQSRFYHGAFTAAGKMATFFFFKDIHMGMVIISYDKKEVGTLYARFTTFENPNKTLALNQFSSPTLH